MDPPARRRTTWVRGAPATIGLQGERSWRTGCRRMGCERGGERHDDGYGASLQTLRIRGRDRTVKGVCDPPHAAPTYRRAVAAARTGSRRAVARRDVVRVLDSYASLLVLLLANLFLLELLDDPRWGAIGSTILSAIALFVETTELVGLAYLLPVALLVTATLPVTISRVLRHQRVTHETVFGALCAYVLIGLLFAFLYLAVNEFRPGPFFTQPGPHEQSEYLYFSFVALTTLGFGDLSPSVGLPQALTVFEALLGQVFLVTMVARLVTLWVRQGRESP